MADTGTNRRSHPFLIALAVVGGLTLTAVIAFMALVGVTISQIPQLFSGRMSHSIKGLHYSGNAPAMGSYVAGIKLEGEIHSEMINEVLEKLDEAEKAERVVGILLEVNSPGGAVVPSQEVYDTILRVKSKKPVVSYVRDVAASGAFYSMASSTKIVANRGSMIGSVGVILQSMEATELFTWLKVKPITIKTGELKDAGNPTRQWTEADKTYLKQLIENTRSQFATDVKTARALPDITMTYLSDGRVVLGNEALDLKLIDKLGTKEIALQTNAEEAKLGGTPELYYMEDPKESMPNILRFLLEEGASAFVHSLKSESAKELNQKAESKILLR